MNFNPVSYFRRKADSTDPTANQGGGIALSNRETQPMGAWSGVFGSWEPRSKSPWLLEALREAIPILDGGINRLTTMDGIIEVEGGNDALVQEIEQWMAAVPVNDLESGYQAFYSSMGAESYEQGAGVGEFIFDTTGREVVGLRVADSKGIGFVRDEGRMRVLYRAPGSDNDTRPDGLGTVESILRGGVRSAAISTLTSKGFVELDAAQLVFALHRPEADNPYGTSILRSMPFVAQILLKMENATGRAWERFGDPPFHIHYATKNRKIDGATALTRSKLIATDLAKALAGKSRGNSVDLATAAAADDEVKVEVIGANGVALEIEAPARHLLEQIVAGFGLPPWMLGITWSQASGIGEQQSVVVLQESQTRFALRKPGLERPIAAMLRARGRTWKPGDWHLVQRLPNLMDEQKRAQAEFLRAQTALMLANSGQGGDSLSARGIDNNLRTSRGQRVKARKAPAEDSDGTGEPWAEDDAQLPKIEAATTDSMISAWSKLTAFTMGALGLLDATGEAFAFDQDLLPKLLARGASTAAHLAKPLLSGSMDAWDRGVQNAAEQLQPSKSAKASPLFDDPAVVEAVAKMREAIAAELAKRGLELVTSGVARVFRERIVAALSSGEFDGQNPMNVARTLAARFDAGDYNWERLARSEIAMAQSDGKLDLFASEGVEFYDYDTAGDEKVSLVCQDLAAAGPYRVDADDSPVPVRDSHPNCRCSIRPRA